MFGTARRNRGQIGIFSQVASFREAYTVFDCAHRSEFGMQGYPDKRTVQAWQDDGDDSQNFPQSRVSANHNKAASQTSRAVHWISLMTGRIRATLRAVSYGEFQVNIDDPQAMIELIIDTRLTRTATCTILRRCRQRRLPLRTDFGAGIGKVQGRSIPRARWSGKWVSNSEPDSCHR